MTSAAALVTRRGGEEVIWREALVMNPRMTETCIDDFIATPTDMGPQTEYKRLVQNLNMRAALASPVGSQSLSNDEWRKMQREEEWVRLATQSNLPKDEALVGLLVDKDDLINYQLLII